MADENNQNQEQSAAEESQASQTPKPPDEKRMKSALASGNYDDFKLEYPEEAEKPEGEDQVNKEDLPGDDEIEGREQGQQSQEGKEGGEQGDEGEGGDQGEGGQEPPEPPTEGADDGLSGIPEDLEYKNVWGKIKSAYEGQVGEGKFKMPEGVTKENEFEQLIGFLQSNLEPNLEGVPEEAREIIELHRKGEYDPQEYFQKRSVEQGGIRNLPDKEFLFQMYKARDGKSDKNPDGLTDQEIREDLNKLSKLELRDKALNARTAVNRNIQERKQKEEQDRTQKMHEAIEKYETERRKIASKVVNQLQGKKEAFGIPIPEEDKKQFDEKGFWEMVKLNPKTGMNKVAELLSDDKVLYEVAYHLYKGNLSGVISDAKEGVKKNIQDKLDRTLEHQKGGTRVEKPVDRSKLY